MWSGGYGLSNVALHAVYAHSALALAGSIHVLGEFWEITCHDEAVDIF